MCFLPCGCSQQDLPVVATTVNEDITSRAIGACSAEPLGGVALLQWALILLHGQTIVGQTQLFVGRFWVQLERLTWKNTELVLRSSHYCVLAANDSAQILIIPSSSFVKIAHLFKTWCNKQGREEIIKNDYVKHNISDINMHSWVHSL